MITTRLLFGALCYDLTDQPEKRGGACRRIGVSNRLQLFLQGLSDTQFFRMDAPIHIRPRLRLFSYRQLACTQNLYNLSNLDGHASHHQCRAYIISKFPKLSQYSTILLLGHKDGFDARNTTVHRGTVLSLLALLALSSTQLRPVEH